jgi:hypothetical protein
MAYGADSGPDFKAIAGAAKKSPKFREMTGRHAESDDADDGGEASETAHLRDAYRAAQAQDEEEFASSMLAAIKACVASYGSK